MQKLTQDMAVLLWLKEKRSINPIQALNELGCFRLAACIQRLRKQGYQIVTTRISKKGQFRMINFAEYRLDSEVNS